MRFGIRSLYGGANGTTTGMLPNPSFIPCKLRNCGAKLTAAQNGCIEPASGFNYPLPHTFGKGTQLQSTWVQHSELARSDWLIYTGHTDTPYAPLPSFAPEIFTPECDNSWGPLDSRFRTEPLQSPLASTTSTTNLCHQGSPSGNVYYAPPSHITAQQSPIAQDDEDSDMDDISSPPRKPSPTARISESPAQGVLKVAWGHDFKPDHDSRPNKKCLRDPRRQSVASSPEVQPGYQLRGVRPNPRIEGSCDADAENLPKSRVSHNMVEKMYRTRLNTQFTSLLEAIPTEITVLQFDGYVDTGGRRGRVSKGDVLTLAKGYIRTLEEGKRSLEQENEENQATINLLRMALVKSGGRYCG